MQTYCLDYVDPTGMLDIPMERHEEKNNFVLPVAISVEHVGIVRGPIDLEACCLDRSYVRYYLKRESDTLSQELNFELSNQYDSTRRLLGRRNTELIAMPERTEGLSMLLPLEGIFCRNVFALRCANASSVSVL